MTRRVAVVEGVVVVNVITVEDAAEAPDGQIWVSTETGSIGDVWDGGDFSPPVLPEPEPPSPTDLVTRAERKQDEVANGGIEVEVSSGTADVASNEKGRGLVTGKVNLYQLAVAAGQTPPPSKWVNNDGSSIMITMQDAITIGVALGTFIQETYDVLGEALAGIGDGSITTYAEIDALPWPTNT